jgi:hypothetical protein
MFRLHWQQAASATSISEGGTDYLYRVDSACSISLKPVVQKE